MSAGMTNEQYNAHLEIMAKLIEATAKTPADAARIVRESKITGKPEKQKAHTDFFSVESDALAVPEIHIEHKS